MAVKWLRELGKHYPHLARTARLLNAEDGFVMDEGSRRRSDHERDGDDGRENSKGGKKHKRRKVESDGDSRSGASSSSNN